MAMKKTKTTTNSDSNDADLFFKKNKFYLFTHVSSRSLK